MTFYLYDPRTNITTETSYKYLTELTGLSKTSLASFKSRKQKISKINCYFTDGILTQKQKRLWYEKEVYKDENWKPIKGTDDKYLISNYGRVKRIYKSKIKFLLPYPIDGALQIKIMYKGSYKVLLISRLVGLHFVGKPKDGERFRHKNGIKTDNFAANLEIVSNSELGKITGPLSKSKAVVRLDPETMEIVDEYRSAREAGRKCFLSYQAVLDNCHGRTKRGGGYMFMFESKYNEQCERLVND